MSQKESKKFKVLHVVGGMTAAGLETLIMNIYRNIDKSEVHFDFAVQTSEKCFYDDEIVEMGGRIITHPKPSNGIKSYKKALEETIEIYGPYDAIHSHVLFFSGIVLDVARGGGIPVRIAHSHNTNDSKKNSVSRKIYRLIMRNKIRRNATHLIGCSREACEYVFGKNSYNSGESKLFPNAIDLSKYRKTKRDKEYLLTELDLTPDTPLLGHIGRFTKQKNHEFIIELFSTYSHENKKAHLVLVGEGREMNTIKEMINEMGLNDKVHLLGLRKDIPQILSAIDLFLFPSLYEGLGIVAVEAQAAGVQSLVSQNIPIEADLNIGLLNKLNLNTDDKNLWIAKIDELLNKEEVEWSIRENALKDKNYDIEVSAKNILGIYTNQSS